MSGLGWRRRSRHCRRIFRWPHMKSHDIFAVRYLVRCTSLQVAHDDVALRCSIASAIREDNRLGRAAVAAFKSRRQPLGTVRRLGRVSARWIGKWAHVGLPGRQPRAGLTDADDCIGWRFLCLCIWALPRKIPIG